MPARKRITAREVIFITPCDFGGAEKAFREPRRRRVAAENAPSDWARLRGRFCRPSDVSQGVGQ